MTVPGRPPAYPEFVIVCDHGVRGGGLDLVWRYRWDGKQGVWTPEGEGVSPPGVQAVIYGDGVVTVTFMEGDRPDWWHADKSDDEHPREHHGIICPKGTQGCTRRSYRADADDLRTVLAVIAVNREFQAVAESVTDGAVAVTLDALHAAHKMCKRCRLLRQHK